MRYYSRYQEYNSEEVPALMEFMSEKQQISLDTAHSPTRYVYITPGRDKCYEGKSNKEQKVLLQKEQLGKASLARGDI